ncbi:MAG TPA: phosphatase PAP2 family protein [Thermoanaerobaculia bacterium]
MRTHPHSKLSICLLLFTMLAGSAAWAQEPPASSPPGAPEASAPGFVYLVRTDLRDVLGGPVHWDSRQWGQFGIAMAGIGASALLDKTIREREQNRNSQTADRIASTFEQFGEAGAFGVMGTFYVVGLASHDARARSVGADGLIASVISGAIIAPVLKFAVGRVRPRDTEKTFEFHPFSGNSSFPSGHTTEAFAVASVISTQYPSVWVRVVSYGSAALVGYARIHHQAHFFSDVTAGAVLGTATGMAVVHRNEEERRKYVLMPVVGPHGEPGVGVALSF